MIIQLLDPKIISHTAIRDFKQDFLNHNETEIPGGSGLNVFDDVSLWIDKLRENLYGQIVSHVFFAVSTESNKLLGIINYRYPYDDYVKVYGHIGYAVRPSERGNGIAAAMLHELLTFSKDLYSGKLLVTCDTRNIASMKTITDNGGIIESSIETNNSASLRFWIDQ